MNRSITMTGELAHKIATGKKSLHLHPARHDQDFRYRRCPFLPGQPIPVVKKADEDPVLHIEVTTSKIVTLAQLTPEEITALGHGSLLDHQQAWLRLHDRHVQIADQEVVRARYLMRWSHRTVWLMSIKPAHAPRYLSARPPSDTAGEGDYTTDMRRAMTDEGEAVPVAYQEVLSLQARDRDDKRRRDRGEGRDVARGEWVRKKRIERNERRKAA